MRGRNLGECCDGRDGMAGRWLGCRAPVGGAGGGGVGG